MMEDTATHVRHPDFPDRPDIETSASQFGQPPRPDLV